MQADRDMIEQVLHIAVKEKEKQQVVINGNIMKYNKENPLRVTTLFSGYDSQALALERIKKRIPGFDYDLVNWC